MTRMFLTYFFFTKSQTKAWLGKVAEPAAVKSLQLPGPGPRPIPMPCWPQETCKACLQMPRYGRGRERQRCPPRGHSHDLGLFLANHWLPSQRPCRQKAQASTGPACHFLTLSEDPRTRRGYRQRERRGGFHFQQRGVQYLHTIICPGSQPNTWLTGQSWLRPCGLMESHLS